MTSRVAKVEKNIKKSYTTSMGTYFVHGITFEGDSIRYDYHSKTEDCKKINVGDNQTYSVTKDKQGNPKIKLEAAAFGSGGQQGASAVQQPIPQVTDTQAVWLSVFRSNCTFLAGCGKSLDDIIKATNIVVDKHVPK